MKFKFNSDRSQLIVSADESERALLREMPAEEIQSDAALWDFLEQLVCNSELEWIRPEETGDLTDAPLLGIRESDESISERWGFMNALAWYAGEEVARAYCDATEQN